MKLVRLKEVIRQALYEHNLEAVLRDEMLEHDPLLRLHRLHLSQECGVALLEFLIGNIGIMEPLISSEDLEGHEVPVGNVQHGQAWSRGIKGASLAVRCCVLETSPAILQHRHRPGR